MTATTKQAVVTSQMRILLTGKVLRRRLPRQQNVETKLDKLWKLFVSGELSAVNLLRSCSHLTILTDWSYRTHAVYFVESLLTDSKIRVNV